MGTLSRITGYKIRCNPHNIIIHDGIRQIWDQIKTNMSIVEHQDNQGLFNALRAAESCKEEALQWMI